MSQNWGYQLILDLGGCNINKITEENTKDMIDSLLKKTKMKALGKPVFKFIHATEQSVSHSIDGFSVVQFIITSSITIHTVNSTRSIFIDFFSCKEFNPDDVERIVERFYNPSIIKRRYITRDILL